MSANPLDSPPATARWPWLLFLLGLAWMALIRVPLVLNAGDHLDSDLAVDGLTVAELVRGQWRWHFPGTPYIGIASALAAAPQMAVWGPSPIALASGGVVLYGGLMLATFLLAWSAFGHRVAAWGLVPMTFASTGTVWLSGRLNGGHILAAAWQAGALALLAVSVRRGTPKWAAVLGLWCGLGLFHDSMFLITIAAIVPAALLAWWSAGLSRGGTACAAAFLAAAIVGDLPRELGRWLDPYSAYQEQFAPTFDPDGLLEHVRILGMECLPRLITGHILPELGSEPAPDLILGRARPHRPAQDEDPLAWSTFLVGMVLFISAWIALLRDRSSPPDQARTAVRRAMLLTSAGIIAAFLVNRNIFNSDNYRYIVTLLVPWSVGYGLAMAGWSRRGGGGLAAAIGVSILMAILMTIDTTRWYSQFGWIEDSYRPVRRERPDPVLAWLREHPDVSSISGEYWDVYRLEFLTGGRVRGFPHPIYPDRFPERARDLPGGRPDLIVVRPSQDSAYFLQKAVGEGAKAVLTTPGMALYRWPGRG